MSTACSFARAAATAFSISKASVQQSGDIVSLRARVDSTRVKGKIAFLILRQPCQQSMQVVVTEPSLIEQVKGLTPETIVDVSGALATPRNPIKSVSCSTAELHAESLVVVSAAAAPLPFPINDPTAKLDTRLDHRPIDMRTALTGSVARLTSSVNESFRRFLLDRDFIEIHTPKMIGTPSEGGSAIFKLDYFGREAYLAQSPQLYKQMMVMGDVPRVFEVGPVFRAEKSLTHRHLTEFVGLDVEMAINGSYKEVLDVLEGCMSRILSSLEAQTDLVSSARSALASLGQACPPPVVLFVSDETKQELGVGTDDLQQPTDKYGARVGSEKVLRLTFANAAKMLLDAGHLPVGSTVDDFSTAQEKLLGGLIKSRYGVDLYVVDEFYKSARPFYTMPHPLDSSKTCSYDMYLRGEEICSGAQRIHDPQLLLQRISECGIAPEPIKDYVNSFKYGAWPHGGFGLGLERIVLFFLGLQDVRMVSLFPRDPRRLSP